MRRGILVVAAIATVALYAPVSGQVSGRFAVPRTADGQPDLQGFWTNDTVTPLERPTEFGDKEVLTPEEAAAYAKKRRDQFLAQDFLRLAVGGGHEIGRSLERHLEMLDLAEVALERAPGLAGGLDHDVEEGGAEHRDRTVGARVGLPAARDRVKSAAHARAG